jgi:hypothetical protein
MHATDDRMCDMKLQKGGETELLSSKLAEATLRLERVQMGWLGKFNE